MSKMINKVFLIGEVGSNPIVHFTETGERIVFLNLHQSKYISNKKTKKQRILIERHKIVFTKKLVDVAMELKKGARIHVEGELCTRYWKLKNGEHQQVTEIFAKSLKA